MLLCEGSLTIIVEPLTAVLTVISIVLALIILLLIFTKAIAGKGRKMSAEISVSASPAYATAEDIDCEIVAVIAAAVAAMAPDGKRYSVRNISRTDKNTRRGQRPAWAEVGIIESTRPF